MDRASRQSVLQHELDQARRTHSARISTLRNEISQLPKRRVRRYPWLSAMEFIRSCKNLEQGIPDSKENWPNPSTTCKLPVLRQTYQRDELLICTTATGGSISGGT
eukprot:270793-Amphidinium_carterae.1